MALAYENDLVGLAVMSTPARKATGDHGLDPPFFVGFGSMSA
jgi:hypothetical protein